MKSKTKYDLNYNIALLFSETASEVENVLITLTLCHLYTCFYLGFLGQLGFAAHAFLVCH